MNQYYLNKLEFPIIIEKLSTYCQTYVGKNFAQNLQPLNIKDLVKEKLDETQQAISLIERNGNPPISEIENIEKYIKLLDSKNTLSAKALLDICNILKI